MIYNNTLHIHQCSFTFKFLLVTFKNYNQSNKGNNKFFVGHLENKVPMSVEKLRMRVTEIFNEKYSELNIYVNITFISPII